MKELYEKFVETHNRGANTSTCHIDINGNICIMDPLWKHKYIAKGICGTIIEGVIRVNPKDLPYKSDRIIIFDKLRKIYISGDYPIFRDRLQDGCIKISTWRNICGGRFVVMVNYD